MDTLLWIIAMALAYLMGSIPFGLLLGMVHGIDIRAHGSGNIGATNVWRVLGKPWGVLCFTLDMLKGAVPVVLGGAMIGTLGYLPENQGDAWRWLAIVALTIVGHLFPVWLRFRGGKGVATAFGALLAMYPVTTIPAVLALLVWLFVLRQSRYVSVASCAAAVVLPVVVLMMMVINGLISEAPFRRGFAALLPVLLVMILLGLVVLWKHRGNLARVQAGTEHRIGESEEEEGETETAPASDTAR